MRSSKTSITSITSHVLGALVLGAACISAAPAAQAQNQTPATPAPPSATTPDATKPSANVPDRKLDAAAAAVKNVTAIRQDYQNRLAQAPKEQKTRIVDEADTAMKKAVTDQGLTVAEYTQILQIAQNDPAIRGKLLARLK